MNAATKISSSTGLNYAMDLAKNSALKRSLYRLGTAIENGNLSSARATLTALIKANPEYSTAVAQTGSQPPDQTDQDFKALTDAISNNDSGKAKSAWIQVKADLAKSGVTGLSDGTAATAKLVADAKASVSQQIISATLTQGSAVQSGNETGLGASLLSAWLTFKTGGSHPAPATPDSTENKLDTAA